MSKRAKRQPAQSVIDPDPPGAATMLQALRALVASGKDEECWLYSLERVLRELHARRTARQTRPPRPVEDVSEDEDF